MRNWASTSTRGWPRGLTWFSRRSLCRYQPPSSTSETRSKPEETINSLWGTTAETKQPHSRWGLRGCREIFGKSPSWSAGVTCSGRRRLKMLKRDGRGGQMVGLCTTQSALCGDRGLRSIMWSWTQSMLNKIFSLSINKNICMSLTFLRLFMSAKSSVYVWPW